MLFKCFIFINCLNLKFLDLSSFDFSNIKIMSDMFHNCPKVEYINLNYPIINADKFNTEIFANVSKNFVLCIKNEELMDLELPHCSVIDCSEKVKKKI